MQDFDELLTYLSTRCIEDIELQGLDNETETPGFTTQ